MESRHNWQDFLAPSDTRPDSSLCTTDLILDIGLDWIGPKLLELERECRQKGTEKVREQKNVHGYMPNDYINDTTKLNIHPPPCGIRFTASLTWRNTCGAMSASRTAPYTVPPV